MRSADAVAEGDTVVVLQSFEAPHAETNPFVEQLIRSLPDDVVTRWFSWRSALFDHFDVFHLHWPEVRLRGSTRVRSAWRWLVFAALLVRIKLQRIALVRTLHNSEPHEPLAPLQLALVRLCDRWTTAWITMVDGAERSLAGRCRLIPHGHYRDWFERWDRPEPVPGRLLHFGLVRRYKGVESLLRAFEQLDDDSLTLHVVGKHASTDLSREIARSAAHDRRVTVTDRYVDDEELAREVGESELVVLPFTKVENSGSLLLALSLARPVLVPRTPVTEALAAEVGPGWVSTFDGELSADTLADAVRQLRSNPRAEPPDLSGREWGPIGAAHARTYREARAAVTRRRDG